MVASVITASLSVEFFIICCLILIMCVFLPIFNPDRSSRHCFPHFVLAVPFPGCNQSGL